MPVHKCPNGKFKIGSGKCMYDSKEKAEKAYKGYMALEEDLKLIGKELSEQKKIVSKHDSNK